MHSLRMTVTVPGTPTKVYDALTSARAIRAWTGQAGFVAKKSGGKFHMYDSWVTGHVLAATPGKMLLVTWTTADWSKDTAPSIVRYDLKKVAKGTKITMTHTGLPTKAEAVSHKKGWTGYVFEPIAEYLSQKA